MSWITERQVSTLLQTDLSDDPHIDGLIAHVQGLAEVEIGEQATPSAGVQSITAQIVARMWQAGQSAKINPAALQSDTVGPFTIQDPNAGAAGLGLTNREKASLKKAVGKTGIWVQPTTRGDIETPPIHEDALVDALDPINVLAAAQLGITRS